MMQSHFNKLREKLLLNQSKIVLTPAFNIIVVPEFAVELAWLLFMFYSETPCQGFVLY